MFVGGNGGNPIFSNGASLSGLSEKSLTIPDNWLASAPTVTPSQLKVSISLLAKVAAFFVAYVANSGIYFVTASLKETSPTAIRKL